jgi:hypothetical protein
MQCGELPFLVQGWVARTILDEERRWKIAK